RVRRAPARAARAAGDGPHAARSDGGSRAGGRRPAEPRRAGEGDPGRDRTGAPGGAGVRSPDELRELVDGELERLPLAEELGELEGALRYSLLGGGKRIRPVLCLATGEALGRAPEETLDAACALELVHTFSLVHDDLPALDDDDLRRGQPSAHVRFGEDVELDGAGLAELHSLKTGRLLQASVLCAVAVAEEEVGPWAELGREIGLL